MKYTGSPSMFRCTFLMLSGNKSAEKCFNNNNNFTKTCPGDKKQREVFVCSYYLFKLRHSRSSKAFFTSERPVFFASKKGVRSPSLSISQYLLSLSIFSRHSLPNFFAQLVKYSRNKKRKTSKTSRPNSRHMTIDLEGCQWPYRQENLPKLNHLRMFISLSCRLHLPSARPSHNQIN